MSNVITTPGEYREHGGGKATVKFVMRDERVAFGFDSLNRATSWLAENGRTFYGYSITGPWIEPPTPPDGYELADRETYVGRAGIDMVCIGSTGWVVADGLAGKTAAQIGENRWFAKPIEKPFRISDKGCGVYETRDGREMSVVENVPSRHYPWLGDGLCSWTDDGHELSLKEERELDLVRYLRPLDETEWKPTMELRIFSLPPGESVEGDFYVMRDESQPCSKLLVRRASVLQQKYTNGTDTEWRAVPVE